MLGLAAVLPRSARAQEGAPVVKDYRGTVTFAHPIIGGFAGEPYVAFDDENQPTRAFRVGFPSVTYRMTRWLQGWSGMSVIWTDADAPGHSTREVRPYVGAKISVPNSAHIHLYDLTRFEWRRITNTDDNTVTGTLRFRTRPTVEFPLSARAWQPGTFYGLASTEALVEHGYVNSLRFTSGAGHVTKDRVRIELQYVTELTRGSPGKALAYSESSLRLNIKLSFKTGLLHRIEDPD